MSLPVLMLCWFGCTLVLYPDVSRASSRTMIKNVGLPVSINRSAKEQRGVEGGHSRSAAGGTGAKTYLKRDNQLHLNLHGLS